MRYFRHSLQHNNINDNTDESIGHAVVPSEGSLNAVSGQVHCQAGSDQSIRTAHLYACDGWLIPVNDPDTVDLVDDIWDRFIEKDFALATGAVDLDTAGTDTISFDEPGIPSPDRIAGVSSLLQDKRWFRRRKLLSFQSNARGFIDGSPDTYAVGDVFNVRSRKRMEAEEMSVAILGWGTPLMDMVTTTHPSTPSETQWIQVKYMEVILEQAWMDLVGIGGEAGAETPWEEATALIADMLEPTVVEDTVGAFGNSATWDVWAQLTFDLSVPGRRNFGAALTGAS